MEKSHLSVIVDEIKIVRTKQALTRKNIFIYMTFLKIKEITIYLFILKIKDKVPQPIYCEKCSMEPVK